MKRSLIRILCALVLAGSGLFGTNREALAQRTAYIGYVYPAGGQRGTTFRVRLGGQRLTGAYGATVTGSGVHAKLIQNYRKLGTQEMSLLREQLKRLKQQGAPRNRHRSDGDAPQGGGWSSPCDGSTKRRRR
ncbi:MAG TPA: hypothetical protein EYP14_03000 [Planctomycetaceae bacterium]|nr:hypothetical protein [Planctomycetaceae bacterium]